MFVFRAKSLFLGLCVLSLVASNSAVHLSTLPMNVPLVPLRGGNDKLRRQLSHEDLKADHHGAPDTADARVYAKDVTEGEHRSLWHDLPLFEVDPKDGKPTGALNFVCEIPKWTRLRYVYSDLLSLHTERSPLMFVWTGRSSRSPQRSL